jgi:Ca2+/Na+ antiporter
MSPPLNYFPAYLGLFAAQTMALTCNAFLDIQYGGFATEVMLWSVVFALSLRTGWRQHGQATEDGQRRMRNWLIFGALLSVVVFIPMWGFPRAALYVLAMLQVAYNCITTTRRHLHMSLLVSVAMVLFAASHYRADWTMLFYLVPYVIAVVFTLVAEQINRTTSELRQQSHGHQVIGAQGTAIAAATLAILATCLALYVVTPQVTWQSLTWRWGQPGNIANVKNEPQNGSAGGAQAGSGGGNGNASGSGGRGADWASPAEMRKAASRSGMPEWQRDAIYSMADAGEWLTMTMKPVMLRLQEIWQSFKEWLDKNRSAIALILLLLGFLALFYALWRLMREAKVGIWLLTQLDYLRLGLMGMQQHDAAAARRYYLAMERLFSLQDMQREPSANTAEYLAQISRFHRHMRAELSEMTTLFEDARYGQRHITAEQTNRMRDLYRQVYQLVRM